MTNLGTGLCEGHVAVILDLGTDSSPEWGIAHSSEQEFAHRTFLMSGYRQNHQLYGHE